MRAIALMIARVAVVGLALATALAPQTAAADEGLGWMAGQWCGTAGTLEVEEAWLPQRDGRLHGVGRSLEGGAVASFEFMRIEPGDAGVPTFYAQPGGQPATAFKRTDGGADWVRFENPDNDFPQRVEYRLVGVDSLHAEIAGPAADGKTTTVPFEFKRCGG